MRLIRQSNQARLSISELNLLGAGGEARVYALPSDPALCAKLYHTPSEAQARKLAVMIASPPDDPAQNQEHITIAWPRDIVRTMFNGQTFAGFVMPRVVGMRPLFNVYNPVTRRQELPLFHHQYLHRAGRNLASAVNALHRRGYIIGDLNESNILVQDTALVTLVDTDSFQVRDPQKGVTYRCPVGKPDFTPPELQGKNFRLVDRTPEHDVFGLAVLLFQLLMEGTHPFAGIYTGEGEPPPYEARILAGHYPHGTKSVPYRPMPLAPPVTILHPTLRALFRQCFEDGWASPQARPDALTWANALAEAEKDLLVCPVNALHRYGAHLDACPWCARRELLKGRDPFPAQAETPYVRRARRTRPVPIRTPSISVRTASPTGRTGGGARAYRTVTTTNIAVTNAGPIGPMPPPGAGNPLPGTGGSLFGSGGQASWPLAPTMPGPSANPGAGAGGAFGYVGGNFVGTLGGGVVYDIRTWGAVCVAILALLLPIFQIYTGLAATILGVGGWRATPHGRWLSALSALSGLAVFGYSVTNRVVRASGIADHLTLVEQGAIRSLTFSRDSQIVATATERNEDQRLIAGEVALWNTRSGDLLRTHVFTGDVASVAYSPDGKLLAAGTGALMEAGRVQVWDNKTWRIVRELDTFKGDVDALTFSPDSRLLITGSRDHTVTLWNLASGVALHTFEMPGEVFALALAPDGQRLAIGSGTSTSAGDPGRVTMYDLTTLRPLWNRAAHSTFVLSLAFAPDGQTLASAGNDNTVRLWDARSGTARRLLETHGVLIAGAVAYAPDGQQIVSGGSDGSIRLWDAQTGDLRRTLTGQHDSEQSDYSVLSVGFSPDGKFVVSGSRDGRVNLWRLRR